MFMLLKFFFIFLTLQPMIMTQPDLYSQFQTVPIPDVNSMYSRLNGYASYSRKLLKFDGNDPTADYTTTTWMNGCYLEFQAAGNASFVVFWENKNFMYCEAVTKVGNFVTPTFPIGNLRRVERFGPRCVWVP
ncbi:hypothetical protein GCK72_007180 [Caenorhabditis remanei]|uniref:Uncharacterized protein n=1 Tax=Caenorhabditis remanei TaxID=31234 RepID=A0A6A5HJA0_CAERE|nr:hypothetical protein GCK72_007180 [Caenorhabditis remanei]KAF1767221.1 hypothetical protein GCK72_007180 [Caenorhabditis remanei]